MRTITVTVRVVPCPTCSDAKRSTTDRASCDTCLDCGEVVATSERLLVGRRLVWDRFR